MVYALWMLIYEYLARRYVLINFDRVFFFLLLSLSFSSCLLSDIFTHIIHIFGAHKWRYVPCCNAIIKKLAPGTCFFFFFCLMPMSGWEKCVFAWLWYSVEKGRGRDIYAVRKWVLCWLGVTLIFYFFLFIRYIFVSVGEDCSFAYMEGEGGWNRGRFIDIIYYMGIVYYIRIFLLCALHLW